MADDSTVMRRIVVRTLRQAGFDCGDVIEAGDGRSAYEAVLSSDPDLVLSDWNMPVLSGIQVLRAIRTAGLPAMFGFITSEVTDEKRSEAEAAGAAFFIAKPFTAETFREVLGTLVG